MLPIQHWTTTTQTPVYFVRTPDLPILELRLIFDAGSSRDGEFPGMAELTHSLLSEGTTTLSAEAVAERFENIGAVFSTLNDHDMAVIALRTLTHKNFLKPALETLSTILQTPAFSSHGLKHQQKLLLSFLSHEEQSPTDLAENAFYKTIYGKHPYSSPTTGTKASIRVLEPAQIKAFYQTYYAAQNASIVIVGDLSPRNAKQLSENIVQILPQGKRAIALPDAPSATRPLIKKIPYKYDVAQSHVILGQVGIKFSDPLFFPLFVGNYILGGDPLISRLGQSVREKQGLVYDVRSNFFPLLHKGPFSIGFQTRADKKQQALETVHKTLRDFIMKRPSMLELQAVKDNITKGYGLNFDSNKAIASNLIMLAFYQLPLDYFDTYPGNILAVTAEQIQSAFKAKINLENMAMVWLGR